MTLVRKRYYAWLVRAYIKKWKRTIISSLLIGIVIFFALITFLSLYIYPHLEKKVQRIGYWGVFTPLTLPEEILNDISYGLTKVDKKGEIAPAAASRWEIKEDGKLYVFYLKKGITFQNGTELTSKSLNLTYKDAERKDIDLYTVSFRLKNRYSPFLATVSKPIFDKNFSGLGEYKINNLDINAEFVRTLTLQKTSNRNIKKIISFYPTEEALDTAFLLGEVDSIKGISRLWVKKGIDLSAWKNVLIEKKTDYQEIVTIFYNHIDSNLSNKKLRQALNYALPETFIYGERAYSPIPPNSIYFVKAPNFGISDIDIAKAQYASSKVPDSEEFTITTSEEYKEVSAQIQKLWKKVGVRSKIKIVDQIPDTYQILVYKFRVPKDPDQYTLWHSTGSNNIVNYRTNKRIDKLLEDGRVETDINKRIRIYADFQKYLVDDVPASFLYFPYSYSVTRK